MLTLEQFKEKRNNFVLYFIDKNTNSHRQRKELNHLKEEAPDLEEKLTSLFSTPLFTQQNYARFYDKKTIPRFAEKADEKQEFVEKNIRLLYEAYKIMSLYADDSELLLK